MSNSINNKKNNRNFLDVTEIPGQLMSELQRKRLYTRYFWTRDFCKNKDVLEVACGAGSGLGLIKNVANTIEASDVQQEFVDLCKKTYKCEIKVTKFSAEKMPIKDNKKDIIIMHEALYYLENPELFISECKRVLRKGGVVLLTNSNKDVYDFNKSPNSIFYHGVLELEKLLRKFGFKTEFWASEKINQKLSSKILSIIKVIAVKFNMIPKTMSGKKFLKRIFYGKLSRMENVLKDNYKDIDIVEKISSNKKNTTHRILYVKASL